MAIDLGETYEYPNRMEMQPGAGTIYGYDSNNQAIDRYGNTVYGAGVGNIGSAPIMRNMGSSSLGGQSSYSGSGSSQTSPTPRRVGSSISTTKVTAPDMAMPTMAGVPAIDEARIRRLTQTRSAAGQRSLRAALREQMLQASYQENPNVAAMINRKSLEGYGQGIAEVYTRAQREASVEAERDRQMQFSRSQAVFNAAMQNYMKRFGTEQTTKYTYVNPNSPGSAEPQSYNPRGANYISPAQAARDAMMSAYRQELKMAQAITTNVAPAVRRYTNIPGKVSDEPGGYKFHELGPKGQVINDPEEFAKVQSAIPQDIEMNYFDYAAKIKADMGDPYQIDVNQEATRMLQQEEAAIFERWSGGRVKYGGFMPKKQEKAWGEYKQKLLSNAQKLAQTDKENKIKEYENKMTEFKIAKKIELERRTEDRLSKEQKSKGVVKGGLTEEQIMERIEGMTMSDEDTRIAIMKYNELMLGLEDNPAGRRRALSQVIEFIDKLEKGEIDPNTDDGLKAAHGDTPMRKYTPAKEVLPPEGFVDTGRTSGGKKVYRSVDGKKAWVQP